MLVLVPGIAPVFVRPKVDPPAGFVACPQCGKMIPIQVERIEVKREVIKEVKPRLLWLYASLLGLAFMLACLAGLAALLFVLVRVIEQGAAG